jgi:hypothetical protein
MLISQPLAALRSQSANPALQLAIAQAPAEQLETALGAEHALPQAPQLFTLVRRLVSHPLLAFPSQSPKPAVQGPTWQMPAEHAGVALATEQTLPQAPQLFTLVSRLVSHPLLAFPSQSPKPGLQAAIRHAPAEHADVALLAEQTTPQVPQFCTSVDRFDSQPLAAL